MASSLTVREDYCQKSWKHVSVGQWLGWWVDKWMNVWMYEWMNELMNEWMIEYMPKWTNERIINELHISL